MTRIDSVQNEMFKRILSLTTAKGLKKEGLFLLSGEKLVSEFLRAPHLGIHYQITSPNLSPLVIAEQDDVDHLQFATELFDELDVLGTHFNILVIEQPKLEIITIDDLAGYAPQGIEPVLPLGDPGNLGALLRSCEAFRIERVILTREAAHPFLPKSVKASAGSVLRLTLRRGPALQDFPGDCLALNSDGISIDQFIWPDQGLLVVGEEGPGLGDATARPKFNQRISIPTAGVESLNVVVAASIALAWRSLMHKPA